MAFNEQRPRLAGAVARNVERAIRNSNTTKPPRKIHRVLEALARGRRYNRFEAERELADHCLHSTVAEIQHDFGIRVDRIFETIPGYLGVPTRCCRYWITEDERPKAWRVLRVVSR